MNERLQSLCQHSWCSLCRVLALSQSFSIMLADYAWRKWKTYHSEMKIWTNLGIQSEGVFEEIQFQTLDNKSGLGFENQSQRFSSFSSGFSSTSRWSVNINSGVSSIFPFSLFNHLILVLAPVPSCLKNRFSFIQHKTRLCTTVRWKLYSQFRKLQLNIYPRGGGEIVDILILHMSGRNA